MAENIRNKDFERVLRREAAAGERADRANRRATRRGGND